MAGYKYGFKRLKCPLCKRFKILEESPHERRSIGAAFKFVSYENRRTDVVVYTL